jgi:hypothetical protein
MPPPPEACFQSFPTRLEVAPIACDGNPDEGTFLLFSPYFSLFLTRQSKEKPANALHEALAGSSAGASLFQI